MSLSFQKRKENSLFSFKSWQNVLGKGLRVFFFYGAVLSLFRVFFILYLSEYLDAGTNFDDIMAALIRGLRLSCQTAGVLTLISLVPALPLHFISEKIERYYWLFSGIIVNIVLAVLFCAQIPFYRQFHSNFNQLVFNTFNDDVYALVISLVKEYYLPLRLLVAIALGYGIWLLFRKWLDFKLPWEINLPLPLELIRRAAFLGVCYLVCLLGIFGGSLGWETSVDWENAGVTKDEFLNEAILDSCQALYRGNQLQKRFLACNGLDFNVEDIKNLAAIFSGKAADSYDLDFYLARTAAGAQIEKPQHIFVILSESFANWPLKDEYANLHIADGMRGIIAAEDSDYTGAFLPNGAATVSALTGTVTGLADANLYLTTMPESFEKPYSTATAPIFKRLGYETNFWYAGPATWERIGAFTKGQGFDNFYSRGNFGDVPGSVWGCEDEYLYAEILKGIKKDKPSFNIILNASNHSPYDVDVAAKGFSAEKVRAQLPEEMAADDWLVNELGHYWYADRELAKFIKKIKKDFPKSLIIVVGDHADRYNIEKNPTLHNRYAIPFIITGAGVHKGILAKEVAGSQIDIAPTIVEMIAPAGFSYQSIGQSLTRSNPRGVNYGFFVTANSIGKTDGPPFKGQDFSGNDVAITDVGLADYINAVWSISWWLPKYGNILDEKKLEEQ